MDESMLAFGLFDRLRSYAVNTKAVITGTTNRAGYFVLSRNPFRGGGGPDWSLQWSSFLVAVTEGHTTTYTWLPITAVGGWYFTHPGLPLTSRVKI
jgi:hypothetical protein